MTQFPRGTIVHHKIMGKGIALNEIKEKGENKIEVRMANGHIEKFYPEELESNDTVSARKKAQLREVEKANEDLAKKLDPFY